MKRELPVAAPALVGRELEYVADCVESTWISSTGSYIERFENGFAGFCDAEHGVACCNGTVALHLALLALGVGPGDEVIVPTLTYVASANAVRYCGADPVLVDSESETWNLDPSAVAEAVTSRTKGIVAVHLYGHPADLDPLLELAEREGLFVLEDAAEAHGAAYKGHRVGGLGTCGMFSFYGNKIITTGEGGMVVTNDADLADRVRLLRGQGQDPERRYWFPVVGFNYRMTNVAAAIGVAQLERIDWHVGRRREIAGWYRESLAGDSRFAFSPEADWAENAYWMSCVVLSDEVCRSRDEVAHALAAEGVDTRPFFYPVHSLPPYREQAEGRSFPVADALAARGLNLPSSALLSREDVDYVCDALRAAAPVD
jgi:perosamine synthetase